MVTKYPYGWSWVSPSFHVLPPLHGRLLGRMPKRGDVVIVTPPGTRTDYIKRVIGLPGDTLRMVDGTLIINGQPVKRQAEPPTMVPMDVNSPCGSPGDPKLYDYRVQGADGKMFCRVPTVRETLPNEQTLRILQNVDALYWQAVSAQASAVSIGEDTVCVFNSTPLEKYESYRLCFERWNNAADDAPDFTPAVYNLIFSLARSLGFRLDSPRNGTQPKFLSDSLPEIVNGSESALPDLSEEDASRLERQGCVYIAATNTFLIREFQLPHVARESTRFLYHACQGMVKHSAHSKAVENALVDAHQSN